MVTAKVCTINAVAPNSGRAVLVDGVQIAIFRVIDHGVERWYAIDNHCPFSEANVLSRGIVGSLQGKTVVASPIYKQHFDLKTGQCLEDPAVAVKTWTVQRQGQDVLVGMADAAAA